LPQDNFILVQKQVSGLIRRARASIASELSPAAIAPQVDDLLLALDSYALYSDQIALAMDKRTNSALSEARNREDGAGSKIKTLAAELNITPCGRLADL